MTPTRRADRHRLTRPQTARQSWLASPIALATRNIGIMAHVDAGKTTTTERILFYTGVTSRIGEVDDGSTVTDWMEQEQERGISITAAATTFLAGARTTVVNLIDTPGHVDFTMEVERSLRVLDGAVAVFYAVDGVEPQSETVWRQADRYRVPRIAFINKCDREGADPDARASTRCRAGSARRRSRSSSPIGTRARRSRGVIDLVAMRARTWEATSFGATFTDGPIPHGQLADAASRAREAMIEAIAELDDELMARVGRRAASSPPMRSAAALRRVTLAQPRRAGARRRGVQNKGIHNLLDAVVDYLPSPADVAAVSRGRDPQDPHAAHRRSSARSATIEPLAALAFKVQTDDARRPAHVRPRLRRLPQRRRRGAQRDQGQARADRPARADVREPPRGHSRRSRPA